MEKFETDMSETLITLTSDIVAAHVSNNSVSVDIDLECVFCALGPQRGNSHQRSAARTCRTDPFVGQEGLHHLP